MTLVFTTVIMMKTCCLKNLNTTQWKVSVRLHHHLTIIKFQSFLQMPEVLPNISMNSKLSLNTLKQKPNFILIFYPLLKHG